MTITKDLINRKIKFVDDKKIVYTGTVKELNFEKKWIIADCSNSKGDYVLVKFPEQNWKYLQPDILMETE